MNILDFNEIKKTPYTRLIISNDCPLHSHLFFEFSICLSGSVTNIINGKKYVIEKGQVLLLRPQDKHEFYCKSSHVSRDIYISVEQMKSVCDLIDPLLYEKINSQEFAIFFKLSDLNLQILENSLNFFNANNSCSTLSLRTAHLNAFLQLMNYWQQSKIKEENSSLPTWISLLIRQINSESLLTKNVAEIVKSTNYSHGYVCREFKKYMGVTLSDYVSETRFAYAMALLGDNDSSIAQISEKLNYCSTSNFIIAFKRRFGLSPAQWRKKEKQ